MHSPIAISLSSLATWRDDLNRRIGTLQRWLADHELLADTDAAVIAGLHERLSADKLVLAFVAEFSRGKSELINAIFFADTGRRVLPATPGRTTMCPVELRFDAGTAPRLSLLPIETRLRGLSLAELRAHDAHWQHVPLDGRDPQSLVQALNAVTRTQRVGVEQAVALGLWSDDEPEDNPPQADDGSVEVPAWRHALINYPHPLLERGLVVIDTPGLNAIGAEPELTLGLLPSAHAVVFVLAADTGVTRSDLNIWQQHLGQPSLQRFAVLNKIDTLADPMAPAADVLAQIEQQRLASAATLGLAAERVFPLSARDALAARVAGDDAALAASRLPLFEAALATELLPQRRALLVQSALGAVQQLRQAAARRLVDRRRQQAEQLIELRGLRGKSGTKLRMMVERIDIETADFERCTGRLAALRSVQQRILRKVTGLLSSDGLRAEVSAMHSAMGARPLNLGARAAFETLIQRLLAALDAAGKQADELRQMLEASFRQLNSEFGFAFALEPLPSLAGYHAELQLVQQSYSRYLTLGQAWRLANPNFSEQFRRLLLSKLRVVFESAAGDVELWSKTATAQVEAQLRERRRAFTRRRDALQRVQAAAGELEQRIGEVQTQDEQIGALQRQLEALADQAAQAARALTATGAARIDLDPDPVSPTNVVERTSPALQRDAA